MKFAYTALFFLSIVGCSSTSEPLFVKKYTLRDQVTAEDGDPMARHEKLRRLYGAVSIEQRKARLGEYYSISWRAEAGASKQIIFYYQQGSSKIKQMSRKLPVEQSEGIEEFSIIGDNYFENGRLLTWKIDLEVNGQVIASKKSYLWR